MKIMKKKLAAYGKNKLKGAVVLLLTLCLSYQCGSDGIFPDPAKISGIVDLDNYSNLELTDLGNVGDINGLGDWSDKGGGGRGADAAFLKWAKDSLGLWSIGLELDNVQSGRKGVKNWITVTRDNCAAKGVPGGLLGGGCPFSGGTIGYCQYGFNSDGEIAETTAIMRKSYLDGDDGEGHKIAVFTHEIGHCLGLKHPDSTPKTTCSRDGGATNEESCVMNPVVNFVRFGSDAPGSPAPEEIEAVTEAYSGGPGSTSTRPTNTDNVKLYKECFGKVCYHAEFPVFHISGNIGRGAQEEDGEREEPLTYRTYIMNYDGTEEIRTTYPDGSVEIRVEGVDLEAGLEHPEH